METIFAAGAASFAGFFIGQSIVKKHQATKNSQTISSLSKNKLQCLPLSVRAKSISRNQFTQPGRMHQLTGVPRSATAFFPPSAHHSQFSSRMRPRDFRGGSRMVPMPSGPAFSSAAAVDTNVINSRNISDVRDQHPHAKQSRFPNSPVADTYAQPYDGSLMLESLHRNPGSQSSNTVPAIRSPNTKGLGNDNTKQSPLFRRDKLPSYMESENVRGVNHPEMTATAKDSFENTARQQADAEQLLTAKMIRLQQLFDDQLELHNLKLTESYYVAVNQLKLENLNVESHLQHQFMELLGAEYAKLKEHHDNAWCYIAQQEKVVDEKLKEIDDLLLLLQQEQLAMSIHHNQNGVDSGSTQGDNGLKTSQEYNISGYTVNNEDNETIEQEDMILPSTCVLYNHDIATSDSHSISSEFIENKNKPDDPNKLVFNEYTCF